MTDEHRYQRIYDMVAAIPRGQVASYGQIAKMVGLPRRARLVGHALRHTPDGVDVPWHRVVNAQGTSSFPDGSEQREQQLRCLRDEGVVLLNGRIDFKRFGWRPSLDELLWKFP